MNRVRRGLAAIASFALTATLLAVGASPATASPASRVPPQGKGTCQPVAPGSTLHRQGAAWSCMKVSPGPVPDLPAPATVRGPAAERSPERPTPAELCYDKSADPVVSTRLAYCVRERVEFPVTDGEGHQVGYTLVALLIMGMPNSESGGRWTEHITAITKEMTPGTEGVEMSLDSFCSGGCSTGGPAWNGAALVLGPAGSETGADATGRLTYTSNTPKDLSLEVQLSYHVHGQTIGARPITNDGVFFGPLLRCDQSVGATSGCIVTGHMANVTFSKSQFHGAAVAYEWAQKNLLGHYGDATHPLTRFYDPLDPEARDRRAATCYRGKFKFVNGATGVPNDSCDEYPFARSVQGGNDGEHCIDITPRQIGGVWDVAGVTVDRGTPPDAPCIRAHVDNRDNTNAGGELGRAVQSDRILIGENYQVIITP
ncbi:MULTISPECIES: NucA/NucB deoxyribonuclease domain-containing protein [Streptomyces]|uniref:NucA/NucB deoxyribonuclease domain-containing protein n=1 Tax=Streptomyces TaxID=1883 RepID=UPI00163B68BD|nr:MULTISPECIES: hypothetical protein [Streptomyces]MBC2879424.1 hypothetical protein [Streptomyces sp. TYQ1024]UBI39823.1 hypothetical protein K7I03_27345 [Streptomyces mobaraensis]UKW32404.1 hypothetical protein MCU78_27280 [Streptomyces sp. TYQ1024]